jgi:hypothetical protein
VEVRPVVMASLKMGELARVALRDCIQLFLKTFENSQRYFNLRIP